MTWLAWRQMRTQAAVASTLVIAIAIVLAMTRSHVVDAPDPSALRAPYPSLRLFGTALIGLPALIGAFWGAPLVARELETGTFRLAWTQSVTRRRWLAVKLAIAAAVTIVVTAAFSAVFTWWSVGYDRVGNRIGTANFGQRGIAPVGYAVFALVLGTVLGMVWRRTLPAMAATLVAFFVVRFSFQLLVRPHLLGAVSAIRPVTSFGQQGDASATKGAWVLSTRTVDAAGDAVSQATMEQRLLRLCDFRGRASLKGLATCAKRTGFHEVVTMQPAHRFWALQGVETALFLVLAVALVGVGLWLVQRRAA